MVRCPPDFSESTDLEQLPCVSNQRRHLLNWERWLRKRRCFQERLARAVNRTTSQLVMNSGDDYREKVEERLLFEHARIPKDDPVRPLSFWVLPEQLRRPPLSPIYFALTKEQKCQTPILEYCKVPDVLSCWQRGGDLGECKPPRKTLPVHADFVRYKERRRRELKDEIKSIQSHKPELESLVVIGKTPADFVVEKNSDVPEIMISPPTPGSVVCDPYIKIAALQIGEWILSSEDTETKCVTHNISLEYGMDVNVEDVLTFKNVGNLTIRFYWFKVVQEPILADVIPPRIPNTSFLFKKTETVLPPGQTYEMKIYLGSDTSGIREETYSLIAVPPIHRDDGFYHLHLWALVFEGHLKEMTAKLNTRLEMGAMYRMVKELIDEILNRVSVQVVNKVVEDDCWNWDYLIRESDIFEAVNEIPGRQQRPTLVYRYDKYIVQELKKLYRAARRDSQPKMWNYSIEDLRMTIEASDRRDEKTQWIGNFRSLVGQIPKSNAIINHDRQVYSHVYNFFCVVIDEITEHVLELREEYEVDVWEVYPNLRTVEVVEELTDFPLSRKMNAFRSDSKHVLEERHRPRFHPNSRPPYKGLMTIPRRNIKALLDMYYVEKYGMTRDKFLQLTRGTKSQNGNGKGKKKEKKASKEKNKKDKEAKKKDKDKGKDKDKKSKKGKDKKGKDDKKKRSKTEEPKEPIECNKYLKRKWKTEKTVKGEEEKVLSLTDLIPPEQDETTYKFMCGEEDNVALYREVLTAYIYEKLGDAIEKMCEIVDLQRKKNPCPNDLLRQLVKIGALENFVPADDSSVEVPTHFVKKVLDISDSDSEGAYEAEGYVPEDRSTKSSMQSMWTMYKNFRMMDAVEESELSTSSASVSGSTDDVRTETSKESSDKSTVFRMFQPKRRERPPKLKHKMLKKEMELEAARLLQHEQDEKVISTYDYIKQDAVMQTADDDHIKFGWKRDVDTSTSLDAVGPPIQPKIKNTYVQTDRLPEREMIDLIALIEREMETTSVHNLDSFDRLEDTLSSDRSSESCICPSNSLLFNPSADPSDENRSMSSIFSETSSSSMKSLHLLSMIRSKRQFDSKKKKINTDYY